ncbi:hypothetical protein FACS1894116_00330 [Betaproteobacteria bacterium]|nr:hypothetical protein AGMMS49543_01650 [Betaproteobacteria bacterium]GHT91568.1 hypothetical protein FACS1894116_00330 [Betaproteobacteria bacterium]GHT97867.1 hypothetical protein FACS1894154_02200 [Betaproteobacteria bacterium]GHT99006.1 hypothetical protein AGMMS49960_03250 [Betaproteobacteria bacterium]GHU19560.1 hypothetical protein AGMMS50243_11850 [Betaproteobacteria bacterium]
MSFKTIVLVLAVGYGVWFAAIGGKQINEDQVWKLYQQSRDAFSNRDAKAYCGMISDDMSGEIEVISPASRTGKNTVSVNKEMLCSSLDEFYQNKEKIEKATGKEITFSIFQKLNSVSISPDKKVATAELEAELRMGIEGGALLLSVKSYQTDKIRRNFGKAKFFHTESRQVISN